MNLTGDRTDIPYGKIVLIHTPTVLFEARVLGKATTCITQSHIVQCIDGTIPNEVYPYDSIVASLGMIQEL